MLIHIPIFIFSCPFLLLYTIQKFEPVDHLVALCWVLATLKVIVDFSPEDQATWEKYNNNNINEIKLRQYTSLETLFLYFFNFNESNSLILYIIWSHLANPWVLDLFYIILSHSGRSILALSRKAPIESHLGLHFCKYNLISYCKPLSAHNSLLWQYCT